ncbi:MAG: PorV/PorQ family protein, partial [Bacteroidia bacterium]|nr:PorV/PorQ family protein [Bacteroidia bacterium]
MKKSTFLSFILLCFVQLSFGQAPKYSNEFLSIGVGARALGMSGANVALTNDATSAYWNPAGLVLKEGDLQLSLMHNEYFAGIGKFDYGTLAIPIDNTRAVGVSVIRFAVDDIPDTIDLIDKDGNINYDRLRSFSTADYAFLFTYSKKTSKEGLRYGGNVKVIHRKVGEFANAWGFGLDLGAQFEHKNWTFGAMGKDITSTFNAWSYNTERLKDVFAVTGNELPENGIEVTLPKVIVGAAYNIQLTEKIFATPEIDLDLTFDGKRNTVVQSDVVS